MNTAEHQYRINRFSLTRCLKRAADALAESLLPEGVFDIRFTRSGAILALFAALGLIAGLEKLLAPVPALQPWARASSVEERQPPVRELTP